MNDSEATIRPAHPADHDRVIAVADDWWGRPVASALPRLFLNHFYRTSLIAEDSVGLAGFLVGFLSPSEPDQAYIHFVGVRPDLRRHSLGRRMYEHFFSLAQEGGRRVILAITPPINDTSVDFHRSMGFARSGPVAHYDRPGEAQVLFRLELDGSQRLRRASGSDTSARPSGLR